MYLGGSALHYNLSFGYDTVEPQYSGHSVRQLPHSLSLNTKFEHIHACTFAEAIIYSVGDYYYYTHTKAITHEQETVVATWVLYRDRMCGIIYTPVPTCT